MRRFLLNATTLFAAFALSTACSPPVDNDAGDVTVTDAVNNPDVSGDHADVRTDNPMDAGAPIFQQCTTNAACGTGGMCLTAFPGGLCTRHCTNDRACGPTGTGFCEPQSMLCFPVCTSGGGECDTFGSVCYPTDQAGTAPHICQPGCFLPPATPPASYTNNCVGTTMCDPNTGVCTATAPTGAAVGAACTMDSDCASNRCITEVDATTSMASGFLGGYCYAVGRLPSVSLYNTPGGPVPPSNCPPGSGALPFSNTDQEGDPAVCFKTCNTAADCRAGYRCNRFPQASGAPFFSNGICDPMDCNAAGNSCPTGYHCVTQPSDAAVPPGQCEAGGTDAGVVDAGVDVPAVDAAVDVPPVG